MATKKTVQVIGAKRLAKKFKALTPAIELKLKQQLFIEALNLEKEMKLLVNQGPPRTGAEYKRAGVVRTRAADGEPAKTDRGQLVADIRTEVVAGSNGLAYEVGTRRAPQGAWTELGTPNMGAKPWAFPSAKKVFPRIVKNVNAAVKVTLVKVSQK